MENFNRCVNCLRENQEGYVIKNVEDEVLSFICKKCEPGMCKCTPQDLSSGIFIFTNCKVLQYLMNKNIFGYSQC
jgi:hypothetical protein